MKKAVWSAVAAVGLLAVASTANAQTTLASDQITVTVNIAQLAKLEVSGDVSFPDTDPDLFSTMTATAIGISARARVAPTQTLNVTVQADEEFFDPATLTVPAADLSWTATGPYSGGVMTHTSPVTLASWSGPAQQNGNQTYTMQNRWEYAPGTHVLTLTYTLATP